MTQSTEMKEFNEKQYQLWLEENKEFLTRFIVENLGIFVDTDSVGGNEYKHTISLCVEPEGAFSQDWLYVQE